METELSTPVEVERDKNKKRQMYNLLHTRAGGYCSHLDSFREYNINVYK